MNYNKIKWSFPGSDILHINHFSSLITKETKYLILGTFPCKNFTNPYNENDEDNWFYSSAGNSFWSLMFYALNGIEINDDRTKQEKINLLTNHNFGITDIIQEAFRIRDKNQDSNLYVKKIVDLKCMLEKFNGIEVIFLTSKNMLKELFKPVYISNNDFLIEENKTTIINRIYNNRNYWIEKIVYNFNKKERKIKVIPLYSPSREIPPFEIKKEMYKEALNYFSCHIILN